MQSYNIYINEKALIITSELPEGIKISQIIDVQYFDFLKFYRELSFSNEKYFYILSETPKKPFNKLKSTLKVIEAAGGLVKNQTNEYLFIKRLGKWDLPKGKIEKGELIEEAAVREVEEECGITVDKLDHKIVETYHVYELKGEVILKITYWFAMNSDGLQQLVPQTEEDITEARWIKKGDFDEVHQNTYPSIIQVLDNYNFED